MILAAGVLFQSKDGQVLFLKRAPGDHAGEWALPGGKAETYDHGDLEQTAIRETLEETGRDVATAKLRPHARTIMPTEDGTDAVDFTTFLVRLGETFEPQLDNENVAWAWAPPDQAPEPLHPGVRIALDRFAMNELDVARAIIDGRLASPQRYHNMSLVALRITGTGMAYRTPLKEHVWRDPGIYLNDEFLARCNGLNVILEHPVKRALVDSREFQKRIVGNVFLPYLKGDEVWGIAKVYDDATAIMLANGQLSTSPGVSFKPDANTTIKLDDGKHLLIEGVPSLLDHVAICEQGVWDKGGDPTGISVNDSRGVTDVTEAEEREDKARKDAEEKERTEREDAIRKDAEEKANERMDAVADRFLNALDSFEKRLDAMEAGGAERMAADKARKDAEEREEEEKADKARKDAARKDVRADESEEERKDRERKDAEARAEEEKADKARKDAARKDEEEKAEREREDAARHDSLATRVSDLERAHPRRLTPDEQRKFTEAQAKADRAYMAFNDSAPRPQDGESLLAYRQRIASGMQKHSAPWKAANLYTISDSASFDVIEDQIFNDAIARSTDLEDIGEERLREIVRSDSTGRRITEFHGHPRVWLNEFGGNRSRVTRWANKPDEARA